MIDFFQFNECNYKEFKLKCKGSSLKFQHFIMKQSNFLQQINEIIQLRIYFSYDMNSCITVLLRECDIHLKIS